MAREVTPMAFWPSLKFRYRAVMPGADNMSFYGRSIDLPTWNRISGWETPIKIKCYHFEGITAIELYNIKKENVELNIEMLDPTGNNVLYTWRMIGDIHQIKYGELDYAKDEVIEAEVTYVAKKVEFEFKPKTVEIE